MGRSRWRISGAATRQISGDLYWRPIGTPIGGPKEVKVPVGPLFCLTDSASMSDVVGSPKTFNPCNHRSFRFLLRNYPHGWTDWNEVRLSSPYPINLDLVSLGDIVPLNWDESSETFGDFCADAFFSLTDQVPPVIDGLHLAQDLLTLRSLARSCWKNLGDLHKLLKGPLRRYGLGHASTWRDYCRAIANNHLTYLFGIKPLERELGQLIHGYTNLFKRLEYLRRTVGKVIRADVNRSQSFDWQPVDYFVSGVEGARQYWRATPKQGHVRYHAQMYLRNEIQGLDRAYAESKALFAELGGAKLASFAWDLIPFSFVLNWIVPVNTWLDRYCRIQPFAGRFVVLDCGCSVKGNFQWDISFQPAPEFGNPVQDIGELTWKSYHRISGLPANAGTLIQMGLSAQQLAILTSLAMQRVRR